MDNKCYVYLPVYNGEKFLKETLDSVLNQDYHNYKVIICDDCSTDNSCKIINEYVEKFSEKIIFIRNKNNMGVGYTLHNCCEKFHDAEYFAQIGHDDIWPKDYLKKQINYLEKSSSIVSFAKVNCIDEHGVVNNTGNNLFSHEILPKLSREELFLKLMKTNFVCAPSSVVKIKALSDYSISTFWGYNNDRLQDAELWLNLATIGEFIYNKNTHVKYRIHSSNLSATDKRVLQGKLEYYSMINRVLHSNNFLKFYGSIIKKECFTEELLNVIKSNQGYSNPLKLLEIDLCEKFLNEGYNFGFLLDNLNLLYQDCGLITKCLKNGQKLKCPISLNVVGTFRNKGLFSALENNSNFIINYNKDGLVENAILIVQEDGVEYVINSAKYAHSYYSGQMIIITKSTNIDTCQSKYKHILVVEESISADILAQKIYSFVEDKTCIFRNGFFDLKTNYRFPNVSYNDVIVNVEDSSIATIGIVGENINNIKVISGNNEIAPQEYRYEKALFYSNKIESEVRILFDEGISAEKMISINNKLYICNEIIEIEGKICPIYNALCYCNNGLVENYKNEILNSQRVDELENELQRIQNSFSYRLMMRIYTFLYNHKLLKIAKMLFKRVMK